MSFIDVLRIKRDNLINEIKNDENLIKEKVSELEIKIETKDLITKILYLKKQEMKVLIDIVNKGLKYSYPDKELIFDIRFEEKNNRVIPEFFLNEIQLKSPFIGDGGGIISMIGLLLYITFLKLKNIKIALLDEVESMVDIEASLRLFEFISFFSKENGISVTLITHKVLEYEYYELTDKIKILRVE